MDISAECPHAPVEAVLDGEADPALVDREFHHDSIGGNGDRLTAVGPEVVHGSGTRVPVREDDTDLRDRLDRAIGAMKEDGSLNDPIRKWFGPNRDNFCNRIPCRGMAALGRQRKRSQSGGIRFALACSCSRSGAGDP